MFASTLCALSTQFLLLKQMLQSTIKLTPFICFDIVLILEGMAFNMFYCFEGEKYNSVYKYTLRSCYVIVVKTFHFL